MTEITADKRMSFIEFLMHLSLDPESRIGGYCRWMGCGRCALEYGCIICSSGVQATLFRSVLVNDLLNWMLTTEWLEVSSASVASVASVAMPPSRQAKEYRSCLSDLINLEFFPPVAW